MDTDESVERNISRLYTTERFVGSSRTIFGLANGNLCALTHLGYVLARSSFSGLIVFPKGGLTFTN